MSEPELPAVPPVDLRQVLYFVTVAAELNFTRAAARLQISAPALSKQVQLLERRLGVKLLVRDTRSVRLTPAGEAFADSSHRLLRDGRIAVMRARQVAGVIDGHLLLALLHEAEPAFEPFLTAFHSSCPDVRCQIVTARHDELIALLRTGAAHSAMTWSFLLEQSDNTEGLRWMTVAAAEVVAVMHPANPLAKNAVVPRGATLHGHPTVLFERDYSPVTFDYAVEQLYGPGCVDPPVREVSVTVRAQEAMARQIGTTDAFAPVSKPVAEPMGGKWAIRSFDPPWWMQGCVVWQEDDATAAMGAFMAAAEVEHLRGRTGATPDRRRGSRSRSTAP